MLSWGYESQDNLKIIHEVGHLGQGHSDTNDGAGFSDGNYANIKGMREHGYVDAPYGRDVCQVSLGRGGIDT